MIRINLLPYREERRKREKRRFIVLFLIFFLSMNAASFVFLLRERGILRANRVQLRMVEENLKTLKRVKVAVERLKRRRAEIRKKLAVLSGIEGKRMLSSYILYSMAKAVPQGDLWLDSVVKKGGSMDIKGACRDPYYISLFMRKLESLDPFVSVSLGSFEEEKGKKGRYVFNLKVGVVH